MSNNFAISVGDKVSIGLNTHDFETEAWIVFPELEVTHEEDPYYTDSCIQYRLKKSPTRFYDKIMLPNLKKPNSLKGVFLELKEGVAMKGEMALVDLGNNNKRWFLPYLINKL